MRNVFLLLFCFSCLLSNAQGLEEISAIEKTSKDQLEIYHVFKANPNIRHGNYILKIIFNNSMYIKTTGNYINNLKEGVWLTYYPPKSKIDTIPQIEYLITYKYGLKDGLYLKLGAYKDTIISGYYKNNNKIGNWIK